MLEYALLTIRHVSQAQVNNMRDDLHLLRAKQAAPVKESTKQPKPKPSKKKGLLHQTSVSTTTNDPLVSCPCYTTYAPPPSLLPTPAINRWS